MHNNQHSYEGIYLFDYILLALMFFISCWYIVPSVRLTVAPAYIVIAMFLLFLCQLWMHGGGVQLNNNDIFIRVVLFSMIIALMYYLRTYQGSMEKATGIITQNIINFGIILIPFILTVRPRKVVKLYISGTVIMLFYVLFCTIRQMIINPTIVRTLAHGDTTLDIYRMQNVGGFGFCYGLCLIAVWLICYLSFNKTCSRKQKILFTSMLIFILLFEIIAQYFTAVIIIMLAFFVALYKKSRSLSVFVVILAMIFFVAVIYLVPPMFSNSTNTIVRKIAEIGGFLLEGTKGGSLSARSKAFTMSLDLFRKSPIIGVNVFSVGEELIGRHSSVFDTLAKVGLIGASVYFILIKSLVKQMKTGISENTEFMINVLLICYIVLLILNPVFVHHEVQFYIFCFLPALNLITDNSTIQFSQHCF